MESHSLDRASQYLNNLLLARGLLSHGKVIDFARPDRQGAGTDATMTRVINLVHELVLGRDRDAAQRESLAEALRRARVDEGQHATDLVKLQDRVTELARERASAEAQERTLKTAVRRADRQAKELKEQMLRMKSTLDQVRAKCLSDVRKRDVELDKLKGHLATMQRGKKEASGMRIHVMNLEPELRCRDLRHGQDVHSAEWSLEKETNDFLAAVVNETSTENVSLRRIITDTMEMLQELTALEDAPDNPDADDEDGIGIPGQYRKSRRKTTASTPDLTPCATLAAQMTSVLGHCQSILKDPSFVPIEEVHVRDQEIMKLRAGWEKMAARWKEAVTMMDDWRRRRPDHDGSWAPHDFPRLELRKSVAMLPNGQPVFGSDDDLLSILYDADPAADQGEEASQDGDLQSVPVAAPGPGLDLVVEPLSDGDQAPGPSPKRRASAVRRAGPRIGKPIRPLQALDLNANASRSPGERAARLPSVQSRRDLGTENEQVDVEGERSDSEVDPGPPLTISEKLAAVEAEALEARQAPLHMTRKRKQPTEKAKKRVRRRSTLSPDELAILMGIE